MLGTEVDVDVFSLINMTGGILCFIGGCLCAGAGIGGGAFYIPVFVLVLGMDPHIAIPLSKATIFGVAIGGYIVNWRKRHPEADRPLIAYDVANVMEPMTLFGTVIGVYLNVIFPAYLILIFLITLLSFTTYKTFNKGRAMYQKEHAEDNVEYIGEEEEEEEEGGMFAVNNHEEEEKRREDFWGKGGEEEESEGLGGFFGGDYQSREEILEDESKIPVLKIFFLILVWCGSFLIVLLKGGTEPDSSIAGVSCGTWLYWFIVSTEFPYLLLVTIGYCMYLYRKNLAKLACDFPFVEGDIKWDKKTLTTLPIMSIVAGIAAGFLGIGGGMVKGPLMLNLGMISHVSTATSSYMILFTSSSTTFQYLILGKIPINFAIFYWVIGLFAAIVGNLGVSYVVKKYKKQSYIAFLLCFCTVMSAILMSIMTILGIMEGTSSMHFSQVCDDNSEG